MRTLIMKNTKDYALKTVTKPFNARIHTHVYTKNTFIYLHSHTHTHIYTQARVNQMWWQYL